MLQGRGEIPPVSRSRERGRNDNCVARPTLRGRQSRHHGLEPPNGSGGEQVQNGERGGQCDRYAEVTALVEQCGCRVQWRNLAGKNLPRFGMANARCRVI